MQTETIATNKHMLRTLAKGFCKTTKAVHRIYVDFVVNFGVLNNFVFNFGVVNNYYY